MPEQYLLRSFELPREERVETRPSNPFGLSKDFSRALEKSELFDACSILKLWDMHREASEKGGTEAILIRIEDRIVKVIQNEIFIEKETTFGEVMQWLYDFPEIPHVKSERNLSERVVTMHRVQSELFVLAEEKASTTENFVELFLHGEEVGVSTDHYEQKAKELALTAKDKALLVKHGLSIAQG